MYVHVLSVCVNYSVFACFLQSQFSQQTIHKSANLYGYDVGGGNDDNMIIDVIEDLHQNDETGEDDEINIEYDENEDEYITKTGDDDDDDDAEIGQNVPSNVYRKGTETTWTKEQIVAYHAELEDEMQRQRQLLKANDDQ